MITLNSFSSFYKDTIILIIIQNAFTPLLGV